jgi:hypothetical protein
MPHRGGRSRVRTVRGLAAGTVLADVLFVLIGGLDVADRVGSVIGAEIAVLAFVDTYVPLFGPPAPDRPDPPVPSTPFGPRPGRLPVQMVGVFLYAVLGVVLIQLPQPFSTRTGGWWAWNTVLVVLILLTLGIAVTIAVLADRPRGPRTTLMLRTGATVVFLAIAGVATVPWWPRGGPPPCGAVQISVDSHLRAQVADALEAYRKGPGPHEAGACLRALDVTDNGARLHDALLATGTPVAAVITSDPAVLRGLDGRWTNLGAVPEIRTKWYTIGLDRASVLLARSEHAGADVVTLDELSRLRVGGFAPLDPLALAVITASDQAWRPGFRPGTIDPAGRFCPDHVILPTRWASGCRTSGPDAPALVVDDSGNTVGAAVIGVMLTPPTVADDQGPPAPARAAAARFLAWLERQPGRLDLQVLNQPIRTVLAPLATENALVERYAGDRSVDVTVVLDASASMARARPSAGAPGFGATAPWAPAVDGVRRWARSPSEGADDRRKVIVAQAPPPRSSPGGFDQRWPRTGPRGGTGLARALTRARSDQAAHARPDRPALIVVVTDGVNLFTERPLSSAALDGVRVVVVGSGPGCTPVTRWVQGRCLTADPDGRRVEREIAAVVAQFREGRTG